MNPFIRRALCLILTAVAAWGTAYSDTPGPEQPVRVQVGVKKAARRPISHRRHHRKHPPQVEAKCWPGGCYLPKYQPTYYIKSIGADGETVTMTDETVWKIADSSAYIAARWIENSPIVITPSQWYSKYDYYITNKLTDESITAKLSQGPFVKYAVFIQQIDWYNGFVYLTNGTRWNAFADDNFRSWQVGQAILIGENNGWFADNYILINVNENNYVTANRLP